jgi:hypothetical protein
MLYVCMYVCMYIYIYVYIDMHIRKHTCTQTLGCKHPSFWLTKAGVITQGTHIHPVLFYYTDMEYGAVYVYTQICGTNLFHFG